MTLRAVAGVQPPLETMCMKDHNNLVHRMTKLRIDCEIVTVSRVQGRDEHGLRDSGKPLVQPHEVKVVEQVLMRAIYTVQRLSDEFDAGGGGDGIRRRGSHATQPAQPRSG